MTKLEKYRRELTRAEVSFTQIAYDGTEELTEIKQRIRYDAGYKADRIKALKRIALDAIKRIKEIK